MWWENWSWKDKLLTFEAFKTLEKTSTETSWDVKDIVNTDKKSYSKQVWVLKENQQQLMTLNLCFLGILKIK